MKSLFTEIIDIAKRGLEIANLPRPVTTLSEAIARIPSGFHLRCGVELSEDRDQMILSACLFQDCPNGGWPDPRHPADKFLDRVFVGITADVDDSASFDRLTINMILNTKWPITSEEDDHER